MIHQCMLFISLISNNPFVSSFIDRFILLVQVPPTTTSNSDSSRNIIHPHFVVFLFSCWFVFGGRSLFVQRVFSFPFLVCSCWSCSCSGIKNFRNKEMHFSYFETFCCYNIFLVVTTYFLVLRSFLCGYRVGKLVIRG